MTLWDLRAHRHAWCVGVGVFVFLFSFSLIMFGGHHDSSSPFTLYHIRPPPYLFTNFFVGQGGEAGGMMMHSLPLRSMPRGDSVPSAGTPPFHDDLWRSTFFLLLLFRRYIFLFSIYSLMRRVCAFVVVLRSAFSSPRVFIHFVCFVPPPPHR